MRVFLLVLVLSGSAVRDYEDASEKSEDVEFLGFNVSSTTSAKQVRIGAIEWKVGTETSHKIIKEAAQNVFLEFLEPGTPDVLAVHMLEIGWRRADETAAPVKPDAAHGPWIQTEGEKGSHLSDDFIKAWSERIIVLYAMISEVLHGMGYDKAEGGLASMDTDFRWTGHAAILAVYKKKECELKVRVDSENSIGSMASYGSGAGKQIRAMPILIKGPEWNKEHKVVLMGANLHASEKERLEQISSEAPLADSNGETFSDAAGTERDVSDAPYSHLSLQKGINNYEDEGGATPDAWLLWGDINHRLDWPTLHSSMWEEEDKWDGKPEGVRSAPTTDDKPVWIMSVEEALFIAKQLKTKDGRDRLFAYDSLTGMSLEPDMLYASGQYMQNELAFHFPCIFDFGLPLPTYKRLPDLQDGKPTVPDPETYTSTGDEDYNRFFTFVEKGHTSRQLTSKDAGFWRTQTGWLDRMGWRRNHGTTVKLSSWKTADVVIPAQDDKPEKRDLSDHAAVYYGVTIVFPELDN